MQVRLLDLNAGLDVHRGQVVVCVPLLGAQGHLPGCLRSALEHSSSDVPIVVCTDAAGQSRALESMQALAPDVAGEDARLHLTAGDGLIAAVNAALTIAAPADTALLSSDCEVAAQWLRDLQAAALADSRIATAMALVDRAVNLDEVAAAVRSRSLRFRPRLEAASGPCVYIRRSALELVGALDSAFLDGRGDESEFSSRCVRSGMWHTLADDVLVLDRGPGARERRRIVSPADESGPVTRSLSRVRRSLRGLSVLIDARILAGPPRGTQIQVLETIAALGRTGNLRLTVLVPDRLDQDAADSLKRSTPLSLVTHDDAAGYTGRKADLVHRPFQVNNPGDLEFLLGLGDRLVITQEDLISYFNPSYFASQGAWDDYRRLTRIALAIADRVSFLSAHARDDALAAELVDPMRLDVVPCGVDHQATRSDHQPVRPLGAAELPDDLELMLCLGTNYRHKNRPFALRVLEELQRRHGWGGRLVFAGTRVVHGSSAPDEERVLAGAPALADAVVELGPVSEEEKAWLLGRASLVIYPTIHEGFGLVPFEAARRGTPCMWAAGTSLSEVLPDSAAEIVAWDAVQSADRALELLRDAAARERNVAAIRAAGARLSWDATAERLLELYESTCDAPPAPAGALERRYRLLTGGMTEDGLRLVGPGGALPTDVQRPLLALATHPRVGTPLFRALRLGYRTSYKLRRYQRRRSAR